MFESRPGTDITLSVTRGTREQMQPQITEITPQEVAAVISTTLKIQGKNLIGATVKFSVPGIDVSPYLTKPKSVDLPVRVGANVPPGEVVLELSTPIGMTQGTFKVTDLKNITGEWEWTGSYAKYDVQVQTGERDLSDELKSVLLGKSDCQTQYLYPSWRSGPYPGRCCK